jgi:c-di-GMP phosphodiesterase
VGPDLGQTNQGTRVSDAMILGQVALGYSPFIDRNRAVSATRLTVFPLRPDAVLDVGQLLHEVGNVWPASGARVSLNIISESLLQDLMLARPSANLMVEVPAFMAVDPANAQSLCALHANGSTMLLKGRPLRELPREVLPCFKYSIIDLADERRLNEPAPPPGVTRSILRRGRARLADRRRGDHHRGAQRPEGGRPGHAGDRQADPPGRSGGAA